VLVPGSMMLDVYVFDCFTYDSKNLDYIPWTRTNLYNITFHYINFVQKHILFFCRLRELIFQSRDRNRTITKLLY